MIMPTDIETVQKIAASVTAAVLAALDPPDTGAPPPPRPVQPEPEPEQLAAVVAAWEQWAGRSTRRERHQITASARERLDAGNTIDEIIAGAKIAGADGGYTNLSVGVHKALVGKKPRRPRPAVQAPPPRPLPVPTDPVPAPRRPEPFRIPATRGQLPRPVLAAVKAWDRGAETPANGTEWPTIARTAAACLDDDTPLADVCTGARAASENGHTDITKYVHRARAASMREALAPTLTTEWRTAAEIAAVRFGGPTDRQVTRVAQALRILACHGRAERRRPTIKTDVNRYRAPHPAGED